jgi:predicted oxidoreductase
MEKIYLSDSGAKVSPAVYGFWRWSTEVDNTAAAMEKIVNLCLDLGINTFDNAEIYGNGTSEEIFGKVMAQKSFKREDIVLFSKCGLRIPYANTPDVRSKHYDTSRENILRTVDNSLRNLKTDYIDVFLLDHLDPISNLAETAYTLDQLRSSGKIRNIGVANFSVFQHQLLASYLKTPIVTNHIELNLLNTSALDNGQMDYIKQCFMRPLVSAPLAGGRIENGTDKLAIELHRKLESVGNKYGANVESTAVAWLIKLGAVPIIGTTNEQRIRNIVNAFSFELDRQDWYELYSCSQQTLTTE